MKSNRHRILPAITVATVMVMSGCGNAPVRDPNFAPTVPVVDAPPPNTTGSIYQAGYGMSLFEDTKAKRVGDLLTVVLVEKTNASKQASTATAKTQKNDMPGPTIFGRPVMVGGVEILNNSVEQSRDFSGDGQSSQSNSLTGNITVAITQVLPNGNLVVKGEKVLSINQGDEYVRIAGIVRPVDVTPDNTISSTKIANAQISYGGNGAIADANQQGWLARFFNSGLWPF